MSAFAFSLAARMTARRSGVCEKPAFAHRFAEGRRCLSRVGNDRNVGLEPAHLVRVDVDANGFLSRRPIGPAPAWQLEPRADPDHQVGLGPQLVGRRQGQPELVVVGDDAAPAAEGHDRRVEHLRQRKHRLARVDRAAADEDHRMLRCGDQPCRLLDLVVVDGRRWKRIGAATCGGLGARAEDVPRHFERRRPAPARKHGLERAPDSLTGERRALDALRPFDEAAHDAELVAHLVQVPAAEVEEIRRHLPGQEQHRLVAAMRRQQCRAGVQHAGPRHHGEHRRAARSNARSRRPCSRRPARAARRSRGSSIRRGEAHRKVRRSARRAGRRRCRCHDREVLGQAPRHPSSPSWFVLHVGRGIGRIGAGRV